ncbi:TerC/Alx family metal homeostasis membrane protein [Clostridium beijerinckii]|uniref:TerC/Alx family metal homeostasis membrane protein n=1 Tax=Clostridium beijerinckii TaxID=1520 RepID=UPI00098C9AFB|nr:TerC/Alx family metal homeostasis membrane protein [Clostridium beijerinckii]NRT76658.1 tellurite resistance protein TerC [Clostridium beijerinckii]OOM50043.1 inner membrane protein alx [Clostridium beijerinckii]
MKTRRHLLNLIFWISLSILFNIIIYYTRGETSAIEYFGGYIVEMSLSLDNLFLFLMIFSSFRIQEEYQERILLYGVIGAMVLRLIFILLGVAMVNKFSFILSIFGVLLLLSGAKIFLREDDNIQFHDNLAVKILRRIMPITNVLHGNKFFVRQNKIIYATPLFIVLLIIEFSDIIFAIDSIPAIFSITTDTFIVYTSNIFAILGLRSMYYILEKMNNMFKFMKYGVGCILIFTGIKLVILFWEIEISVTNSVLIILSILLASILISLLLSEFDKFRNRCKRRS